MERLSAKEFASRWFRGSLWVFPLMSAFLSCLGVVSGSYFAAYPSSQGSCMAIVLFLGSALFLLLGFLVGVFTAPYYMSREDKTIRESLKMSDGIRGVILELINARNEINSYKGLPDKPYPGAYEALNGIQDQIDKSVIVKLKSLLPDEGKDV